MEKVIVASIRGTFCALMLAGLAACGGGSESETSTPAARQPSAPVGQQPTNPNPPANPTEPSGSSDTSDGNVAPQITGSPAHEVAVGQSFNFTPVATDADGDDLTFSISSKPSWASFDETTGRLSGTPSAADVGSHEDIVITVTDGEHTKDLPEFAVNVVERSNGSATLAWTPPTQNVDGTALTNLKGYQIHYGMQAGEYDQTVTVNNAGVSSYVIENLAPGTYHFAISAITTSGAESEMSGEASKTI